MMLGRKRLFFATVLLSSCGCAGSAQAQLGGATPRNIRAHDFNIRAHDFMDTFGVNVHLGENGYRGAQAVTDAMNLIGFSRVRCSCVSVSEVTA